MIKSWVFEFLPELGGPGTEPDPRAVTALFARYLDLWVRDEKLGFEGIFLASTISADHIPLAKSPDRSPRLANEDAAARRHGGRAALLSSGAGGRGDRHARPLDQRQTGNRHGDRRAAGTARLDMTMTEARERNDEIVAILDAALANRVISHHGKYFSFSDLRMLPRPCSNRLRRGGRP